MTGPAGAGAGEPRQVVVAEVTEQALDGSALLRDLASSSDGAIVLFEGRVRDHNAGREVVALHYEAYAEMAGTVLAEIAREAAERWRASAVGVRHRTGTLVPGDVSLVVAVLAPHRAEAFGASRYVIEELKKRAPIFKREEYRDGTSDWLGGDGDPPAVSEEGELAT